MTTTFAHRNLPLAALPAVPVLAASLAPSAWLLLPCSWIVAGVLGLGLAAALVAADRRWLSAGVLAAVWLAVALLADYGGALFPGLIAAASGHRFALTLRR